MSMQELNERDLIFAQDTGENILPNRRGAFICAQAGLLFRTARSTNPAKKKCYCAVQVFPSALAQVEPASFFNSKPVADVLLLFGFVFVRTSMARPVHCCATCSQCRPESPLKNNDPARSISSVRFCAVAREIVARPLGSFI